MATYGTVNAENITSSTGGVISPNITSLRNRIINGAMIVSQYNGSSSVTVTNAYVIDRFAIRCDTGSSNTAGQSTIAPTGFINSLVFTTGTGASPGSSAQNRIYQGIEGLNVTDLAWGTANAKTITLSFWVRSSLTGQFGGVLNNSAFNRSYPFTYTILSANTWTQISITIPGDTSGTWITTNGVGIGVFFDLGMGSTLVPSSSAGNNTWNGSDYRGAYGDTAVVGTSGATFYITGVQLEVGAQATSFDYRPYGTELALCQRYYYRKNAGNSSENIAVLQAFATAGSYGKLFDLPVTMRANATVNISSVGHLTPQNASGSNTTAFTGLGGWTTSNTLVAQSGGFTGSSGLVAGNASVVTFNTASGWIDASAEL